MEKGTTYVGLDVHKRGIAISVRWPGGQEPERRSIANEPRAVGRFVRWIKREATGPIRCAYEAGPCGYELQRKLLAEGIDCQVIAPSLIPRKPGERIKTDTRDARKLAELLEGGLLTEVHPPTPEAEAVRDLCRAREDAKQDLMRARHRLSKFLLRRGLVWGAVGRPGPRRTRRGCEGFGSTTPRTRRPSIPTVCPSIRPRSECE